MPARLGPQPGAAHRRRLLAAGTARRRAPRRPRRRPSRSPPRSRGDGGPERHVTDLGVAAEPRSAGPPPVAGRRRLRLHQPAGVGAALAGSPGGTRSSRCRSVDPREAELPDVGLIYVEDAETGEQIFVDTERPRVPRAAAGAAADERQAAARGGRPRGRRRPAPRSRTDEDLVRARCCASPSCAGGGADELRVAVGAAGPARGAAARRRIPAAAAAAGPSAGPSWPRAGPRRPGAPGGRPVAARRAGPARRGARRAAARPGPAGRRRSPSRAARARSSSPSTSRPAWRPRTCSPPASTRPRRPPGRSSSKQPATSGSASWRSASTAVIAQQPTDGQGAGARRGRPAGPQGGTSLGRGILTSLSAIAGKPIVGDEDRRGRGGGETPIGYYGGGDRPALRRREHQRARPATLADLASAAGVKIYPIGLGSAAGHRARGRRLPASRRALDEAMLKQIAETPAGPTTPRRRRRAGAGLRPIELAWMARTEPHEITSLVRGSRGAAAARRSGRLRPAVGTGDLR